MCHDITIENNSVYIKEYSREIKRMLTREKDQSLKTVIHKKEHIITPAELLKKSHSNFPVFVIEQIRK